MFIAMKKLTFILLIALMVTGCSNSLPKTPELPKMPKLSLPELPKMPKLSLPSWVKPKVPSFETYSPTTNQGSYIDIEKLNLLSLGMSKSSVINLIGTPSISDTFNQNQWDYINFSSNDGNIQTLSRLTLLFKNNLLVDIDKSGL